MAEGTAELIKALNQPEINTNKAKNIILFLGDGMGFQTIMAARVYKGQLSGVSGEESSLNFEHFPNVGLSKVSVYFNKKIFIGMQKEIDSSFEVKVTLQWH